MAKPDRCKGCPLYETGVGPVEASLARHIDHDLNTFTYTEPRLVVCTDSPEQGDAEMGPYQSQAGRLFKAFLMNAGMKPTNLHLTYLCKCYNPVGKGPQKPAIEFCKKAWLDEELQKYGSQTWLVAGKEGCQLLTGEPLSQAAGYIFRVPGGAGIMVPISSPTDVIKNSRDTGATKRHILKTIQNPTPEPTPDMLISPPFSKAADFLEHAKTGDYIVFDTETRGLEDLTCISIAITDQWGKTLCMPWSPIFKNMVKPLMEDPSLAKVAHNITFDGRVMRANGIEMLGDWVDTMRLVQLDDIGTSRLSLEATAPLYVNTASWKRKGEQEGQLVYNAKDSYYTYRMYRELEASLYGTTRWTLFQRTKNLEKVVAAMEDRGFQIDITLLQQKRTEISLALSAAKVNWETKYGDVNPNSPKQLKELLTNKGINFWRNHEGKESTDEASLKKMKARQPDKANVIDDILEIRSLQKVNSVYCSEEYLPKQDGALHTRIKITGTVSGRPSFSQPNLGNIPKNKDRFNIRDVFVARPGYKLVSADWSQAETRVTAILAQEETMLQAWRDGRDIHKAVASALFNTPESTIEKRQREIAKRLVYALSYGSGSVKVSEVADLSLEDSKKLIRRFAKEFPSYFNQLQQWGDAATETGYLVNPFGRVHNFSGDRVYTQARNFIPQSTVADMMNIVLCQVWTAIEPLGGHVLLQIYDQIILEAPLSSSDACVGILRSSMNQPWPELDNNVIPADVTVGDRWGEL